MTENWVLRAKRSLAVAGIVLVVAGTLAGCGRKGSLENPPDAELRRSYPAESKRRPVEVPPVRVGPATPLPDDVYMLRYPNP